MNAELGSWRRWEAVPREASLHSQEVPEGCPTSGSVVAAGSVRGRCCVAVTLTR